MTVKNVYCLFEQSGTFKKEFHKLGIPAFDYGICNDFGETSKQVDLFVEINCAPAGKMSLQYDKPEKFTNNVSMVERSMISPDYARNFICDNILGIDSGYTQPLLFNI